MPSGIALNMEIQHLMNLAGTILEKAWKDDVYKAAFIKNPKSKFVDLGYAIPDEIKVIVETCADRFVITNIGGPRVIGLGEGERGNLAIRIPFYKKPPDPRPVVDVYDVHKGVAYTTSGGEIGLPDCL